MSCIRLNIVTADKTISGDVHGSIGDAVVAALSAEPETIGELELALTRFVRPEGGHSCAEHGERSGNAASCGDLRPFAGFRSCLDLESWDAGVIVIDLPARVVAVDSTYSMPQSSGDICCLGYEMLDDFGGDLIGFEDESSDGAEDAVRCDETPTYYDEARSDDAESADFASGGDPGRVVLPYRLPDDWLFVYSIFEYEGVAARRRAERSDTEPLDARAVLFGRALSDFIAQEVVSACAALAREAEPSVRPAAIPSTKDPAAPDGPEEPDSDEYSPEYKLLADIHAKWLMAARADLHGRTPRELLLERRDFIEFDLNYRQLQWSFTGQPPPALPYSSHAYRFAGFGTEEIVIYYYLVRLLLRECYQHASIDHGRSPADEADRLEKLKTAWLETPNRDYMGRPPALIIDSERRRLPIALSGREAMVDEENCAVCAAMAKDRTPYFWHLDGCNMDDRYEFTFFKTPEEWEADKLRWEEFNREFAEEQAAQKAAGIEDGRIADDDDEDEDSTIH